MKQMAPDVREAAMRLVFRVCDLHPAARVFVGDGGHKNCPTCDAVTTMLNLLDAEQREYGPPIDRTDPSFREQSR